MIQKDAPYTLGKKILTILTLGLVVLGPLLFIPGIGLAIGFNKSLAMGILFFLTLVIFGIYIIERNRLNIPRHWSFGVMGLIILLGGIGSFFAPAPLMSLFGYGFETTTFLFLFIFAGLMLLGTQIIESYEVHSVVILGLLGSGAVIIVLQILRFILGDQWLTLGVLGGSTTSLLGNWGDLAVFLGVLLIISLTTLDAAPFQKWVRVASGVIGGMSLVLLVVMNNHRVLFITGFLLLVQLCYIFFLQKKKVPWFSLGAFAVVLLGVFIGGPLNQMASRHQPLFWTDIIPNTSIMIDTVRVSWKENIFTGSGLNTFQNIWNQAKPVALSGTAVGGVELRLGSGYIPTQMATQGILGSIAWLVFLILFFMTIVRALRQNFSNSAERYFTVTFSGVLIYLVLIIFFYIPGGYPLILFAILWGIFMSMMNRQGVIGMWMFFQKTHRKWRVVTLGVVIILIGLGGIYFVSRSMISLVAYARGSLLLSQDANKDLGIQKIMYASELMHYDIYHNKLAEIALNQVIALSENTQPDADKTKIAEQVSRLIGFAVGNVQVAIQNNPSAYKNYIMMGNIYRLIIPLGVTNAYQTAAQAYTQAVQLNPRDATMYLLFARLSLANKNITEVDSFIQKSLDIYPTKDAYIMRAQLKAQQNKWTESASALEQALRLDPGDISIYINLAVTYEKSEQQEKAQQMYEVLRKRFDNADTLIANFRKQVGL